MGTNHYQAKCHPVYNGRWHGRLIKGSAILKVQLILLSWNCYIKKGKEMWNHTKFRIPILNYWWSLVVHFKKNKLQMETMKSMSVTAPTCIRVIVPSLKRIPSRVMIRFQQHCYMPGLILRDFSLSFKVTLLEGPTWQTVNCNLSVNVRVDVAISIYYYVHQKVKYITERVVFQPSASI